MEFIGGYAEWGIAENNQLAVSPVPRGHLQDNEFTGTWPQTQLAPWSALAPKQFLLQTAGGEISDDVYLLLLVLENAHLTGGLVESAHDQHTAISQTQRRSGFQTALTGELLMQEGFAGFWPPSMAKYKCNAQEKFRPLFHKFVQPDNGDYPPDTEYNHIYANGPGPLKTNW